MRFEEYTCKDFVHETGSKSPVPGGGGVSALAAALGTALGNMVGHLTTGKKKYAAYEEDIQRLMGQAEELENQLLGLIDRDAEGFRPLAEAYRMPSGTEEEKEEKERVLEEASVTACEAPMEIMRCCCRAIDLIEEFAEKGSVLAISDAGAGAIICKGALQSASLNVFINTKGMKNRVNAERLDHEAEDMLMVYTMKADKIYASVYNSLRIY